jgi:hypothetical protein
VAEGRVDIACVEEGDNSVLTWTESGGPPVDHEIDGDGFGTLLAKRRCAVNSVARFCATGNQKGCLCGSLSRPNVLATEIGGPESGRLTPRFSLSGLRGHCFRLNDR